MDPITTAIVAALPALAVGAVKTSIKDAYEGLKAVIRQKWGEKGSLTQAVTALEAAPNSQPCAVALAKNIADAKATEDTDVMQALGKLVEQLQREGLGGAAVAEIKVVITGGVVQGVVGANSVSVGSLNFGTPPPVKP